MRESKSPIVLWDYVIERRALIHNAVNIPLFQTQSITPHECTFGNQSEIPNIYNFGWYEWVHRRNFVSFPKIMRS